MAGVIGEVDPLAGLWLAVNPANGCARDELGDEREGSARDVHARIKTIRRARNMQYSGNVILHCIRRVE